MPLVVFAAIAVRADGRIRGDMDRMLDGARSGLHAILHREGLDRQSAHRI